MQKRSAGLAMALVMAAAVGETAEIQVKTTAGLVKGTTTEDGRIRVYKGIPFGAPPVGELRWQAPRPAAAWPGVREATEFGSRCMQGPIFSDIVFTNKSEDCLNLNLWTPAQKADEGLPVMVWIHGGGFQAGSGAENRHDGTAFARKDVVIVTINYRLGVFGFFSHPELSKESGRNASGNYGLLDQVLALAVGPRQHRRVRRRPEERHDLRRVGGLLRGQRAHGLAARDRASSTRRSAKAAPTSRSARAACRCVRSPRASSRA